MEIKLKENKWLVLAWTSLVVAGSYVIIDLYNKRRLHSIRGRYNALKQEDQESEDSSYGKHFYKRFPLKTIPLQKKNSAAEVSSQMPEPLPTTLQRKITRNDNDLNIHKICITGGPCAGKTTGFKKIFSYNERQYFLIFILI